MRRGLHLPVLSLLLLGCAAGCTRTPPLFSEQNARAHVNMLADTIGSRPAGTRANASARAYIVDQLRQSGFQVRVQETDARQWNAGITARVANIIAVLPGERSEAVGLLSHFDSAPDSPGGGDDALGVAVALETARVSAGKRRRWSLFVLITDAEESGLMGAAALIDDREVMDRLHAYINVESIGSAGVPVLFEAGPGNGWLTSVWARHAPHPRGGSYAIEIYKRLPNDTDFSVLKTENIPGLNFAAIGDSYAYHTPRDTAARLSSRTIRTMGENAVAIVDALQNEDVTRRSETDHTFFDVAGTIGISYGLVVSTAVTLAALALAAVAWVRIIRTVVRTGGFWRWLLMAVWTAVAAAVVVATMVAAAWLLRSAREVYHPWYAHPGRMVALLVASGAASGWALARAGRLLPARAHGARHPAIAWSLTLPVWMALALVVVWYAPAAGYLWTVPLLAAGLALSIVPPARDGAVRVASVAVFAVTATLWARDSLELVRFVVAVMGRFPFITPVWVYPALIAAATIMLAPPFIAAAAPPRPLARPTILTSVLLLAVAISGAAAYVAPAYTRDRPLRRHARALQDGNAPTAVWEVGSVEPGLDLGHGAPAGFAPAGPDPAQASVPWGRLTHPFVFRTPGPALGPPPAVILSQSARPAPGGSELSISVIPRTPGVTVTFVLPAGLAPARSNLPGAVRAGRWTAVFVAPPAEGITWRASFSTSPEAAAGARVVARTPWGMQPPSWLPQERSVWTGGGSWVLEAPAVAASPPLR